jgi:hypothetical protein
MAKLVLHGEVALVELTSDPEDGETIASCRTHTGVEECSWTERYRTLSDAAEYAADHADYGRG